MDAKLSLNGANHTRLPNFLSFLAHFSVSFFLLLTRFQCVFTLYLYLPLFPVVFRLLSQIAEPRAEARFDWQIMTSMSRCLSPFAAAPCSPPFSYYYTHFYCDCCGLCCASLTILHIRHIHTHMHIYGKIICRCCSLFALQRIATRLDLSFRVPTYLGCSLAQPNYAIEYIICH